MSEPSAAEQKRVWRDELTQRVAAIPPGEREAAAVAAARNFLELPEIAASRRVLVCLSFGDEISTAPVIEALEASGRELYVPRAEPRDRMLHVHRYPCELVTLGFGLRQPPRGSAELAPDAVESTLEAALVLGLGFDLRGFRLGHGAGYFDRFLAGHRVYSVGFAFEAQTVDRLPSEPHDIPMSALVTESAVRRFEPLG